MVERRSTAPNQITRWTVSHLATRPFINHQLIMTFSNGLIFPKLHFWNFSLRVWSYCQSIFLIEHYIVSISSDGGGDLIWSLVSWKSCFLKEKEVMLKFILPFEDFMHLLTYSFLPPDLVIPLVFLDILKCDHVLYGGRNLGGVLFYLITSYKK